MNGPKVRQLLWRDPHQLYQRLEAIVKDCVLEQKVKLIKLLKTQAKNPSLAQDFIQSKLSIKLWVQRKQLNVSMYNTLPFWLIQYCHSNKSAGKETGKAHLCVQQAVQQTDLNKKSNTEQILPRHERKQLMSQSAQLDMSHIWSHNSKQDSCPNLGYIKLG